MDDVDVVEEPKSPKAGFAGRRRLALRIEGPDVSPIPVSDVLDERDVGPLPYVHVRTSHRYRCLSLGPRSRSQLS